MVTMTTLRSKISYWQSQGLITEVEPDLFVLEEDNVESVKVEADVEDYDIESAMPSARDQRNEELQVFLYFMCCPACIYGIFSDILVIYCWNVNKS